MLLISHRGNCDGLNQKQENTPDYIDAAINRGYDVEVDIWFLDDKFWLGHDRGDHEIAKEWLFDRKDKFVSV